uniref:Fibroblast growth factor n=1 Tax=Ascaris lumbricoides TaxID=6252 RepID=A0A0M3HQI5_ASCLU
MVLLHRQLSYGKEIRHVMCNDHVPCTLLIDHRGIFIAIEIASCSSTDNFMDRRSCQIRYKQFFGYLGSYSLYSLDSFKQRPDPRGDALTFESDRAKGCPVLHKRESGTSTDRTGHENALFKVRLCV